MADGVLQLVFKERSCAAIVESLLPTITHYRSEGKSLPAIYDALYRQHLLVTKNTSQMTLDTFRNTYYKQRKKSSVLEAALKGPVEGTCEKAKVEELPRFDPAEQLACLDEPIAVSAKTTLEKADQEVPPQERKSFKRLELGGTLDEQFETGAMYFRKW